MSETTDRLDAIQARAKSATPGPWHWDESYGDANDTGLALTNEAGAEIIGAYNYHCCSFRDDPTVDDNDAEFIAKAPADVAFLLDLARKQQAQLAAVRDFIGWCDAAASREEEFYSKGKISAIATAERLREALEAKP